ncbi:hypothetical protein [Nonomuraea dietziae]|uniref:hypothetical protein n=1 Tax=Nonomuraea dietziae TaxID=65515 RepID=UPI003388BDC9
MVSDLPRRAVTRSAKLATLPLGFAGARTVMGIGKRIGGKSAELVAQEVSSAPPSRSSRCSVSSRAGR